MREMFEFGKPQKRIHTTINFDDYKYIKKHQLKAAHLIRAMVRDHRVHMDDPDANPTIREMKKKLEGAMARLNKVFAVLGKELPEKQFDEILQKI